MNISAEKLSKLAIVFALAAFSFVALLGLGHLGFPMAMEGGVTALDCPYMPGVSLCNMATFEHISSWQAIFTALPMKQSAVSSLISLILVLLAAALGFVWLLRAYSPSQLFPISLFSRNKGEYIPRNFLKDAISSGILNPKIF